MLNRLLFIPLVLVVTQTIAQVYTKEDRADIYRAIIHLPKNNGILLFNEIRQRLGTLDVDGDIRLEFERDRKRRSVDLQDSMIGVMNVCVNPVIYRLPLITYLDSLGLKEDTAFLLQQVSCENSDSLINYMPVTDPNYKNVWMSRGIMRKPGKQNILFLSTVIFSTYNIAFVQVDQMAMKKNNKDYSEIIILKKTGTNWDILTSMESKSWTSVPPKPGKKWLTY